MLAKNASCYFDYPGGKDYQADLSALKALSSEYWTGYHNAVNSHSEEVAAEGEALAAIRSSVFTTHRKAQEEGYHSAIKALCPNRLPQPTQCIGSGYYGAAYLTTHPHWVLKYTTSPYEVERIKDLLDCAPELVCDILEIIQIGTGSWIIWKEVCQVGYLSDEEYNQLHEELLGFTNDAHAQNVGYDRNGVPVVFDP